ncbi:SpoIIE family protein phosphatase [Paludicola sp. MB14-C6]|uniref:SpoIIE family protein phosphatase n=1 Tax=Paludihabitans sp. MB14-C6 TaxID=3070656 RepID=UPI0027DD02DA|nr:SpoIIE family protein phosphatase [Paludicola sp. MB14-C6]WMJ22088.1 SpoIIE family protein phosphatase [Paludicola sp. MB14-C6]
MKLFIDEAHESLFKYGEELCGDKVEIVRQDDFFLAVLADGLGSGVKANILSTLTSKIIATMLAKGATLVEAVETIASTLPVCSERGIAYSTFTIVKIENSGMVYLAEFDNPSTVYLKNNIVTPIQRDELSIEGKTIYISYFQAEINDMIVSFSDGVVHAGVGRLLDLGWQYDNIVGYIKENMNSEVTPRTLCRKLLASVNTLYMDKPGDDSTVCAMRIKPIKPLTVMVGPPMNSDLDKVVVDKLMYNQGLKVVCGGTTSQIVSRITGKELDVQIDYENPAVPPTAKISGIDLVTEGVLTLRKCLEYMKLFTESGQDNLEHFALNKQDGATRLTRIMLEECTEIHFLVGQALNPAHQNPGMPVSLGLKLNLIKDLAKELQKTGKKVSIEFF